MNKQLKVVVFCSFLLMVLIGGLIFRLYATKTRLNPAACTTIQLYQLRSAIGKILAPGNTTIEDLLVQSSQDNLKATLANLLRKRGFASVADILIGQDGWGHSYYVDWRTNLTNRSKAMLEANENSLLIWSSGENGINEYGGGDDFYDSTDWRLYVECYKQSIQEGWDESER